MYDGNMRVSSIIGELFQKSPEHGVRMRFPCGGGWYSILAAYSTLEAGSEQLQPNSIHSSHP